MDESVLKSLDTSFGPSRKAADHVQDSGHSAERVVTSKMVIVAVGPSKFADAFTIDKPVTGVRPGKLTPIGVLQSFAYGETKNVIQVPEIGSEAIYTVSGRTVGGITMNFLYIGGPSLLRYLSLPNATLGDSGDATFNDSSKAFTIKDEKSLILSITNKAFDKNVGCAMFIFRPRAGQQVSATEFKSFQFMGGLYFENSQISTNNMGFNATDDIIPMTANLAFSNVREILGEVSTT